MTGSADAKRVVNDRDPVRPKKMADMVANRIRQIIARGEIADGDWLPTESQLIEQFGVSRPTLREAFRLLEADSLVTIRRGPPGGAQVTIPGPGAAASQFGMLLTLSGTTLSDVYDARVIIEPAAAGRLADHGPEASRRALGKELDRVREVTHSRSEFGAQTVRFHQRIVELSGNQTLATVVGMLSEVLIQQLATRYYEVAPAPEEADTLHKKALSAYERLVELVGSGDGAGADAFWRRHMRVARKYVLRGAGEDETQVLDLLY